MKEQKSTKNIDVIKLNNINFKPKVSVIIPCYNVERYVDKSLQSILEQTMRDIEVICVDDGSTDETQQALVQRAKLDERISVLHQPNSGQGKARNQGALLAQGEYLYFMDGDDLLENNALEELYERAVREDLDVLYFDGISFFDTEQLEQQNESYAGYYLRKNDYSGVKTGIEMMCAMRKNKEYRHSPCLQLIKNAYFHDKELWFLPGVFHEDNSFTFRTMVLASKVGHMNVPFFCRRIREESVMTSKETFKHCYGYFVNYLNMLQCAWKLDMDVLQEEEVSRIVHNAIKNARKTYRKITREEQENYNKLPPLERDLFKQLVVKNKKNEEQKEKQSIKTIFGKNRRKERTKE